MEKIIKHIKEKKFDKLYFFHGEEVFLSNYYVKLIKKHTVGDDEFNFISLDSEDVLSFQDAIESTPVFSEEKLVIIKGLDFSKEWKSDTYAFFEEMLENMPYYTRLILVCATVDKKSKIYKLLSSKCTECVFEHQKPRDIVKWIIKVTQSKGVSIDVDAAEMMTEYAGVDMNLLINEIDKLASYTGEGGKITAEAVEQLCTKNINAKVYSLMDAIMARKATDAFLILNELKREKEEPNYINGSLMRNILGILQYKALKEEGKSIASICEKMNLRPFVQKKYAVYEKSFKEAFLIEMVSECSDFDVKLKSGGMDGYSGLTLLISKMIKG
ncbi:MAG: DNA polymerase III subunit delta [Clostridia bacterium]|nr:DNA polymerase III subunit delta [Clostridia bacterium]